MVAGLTGSFPRKQRLLHPREFRNVLERGLRTAVRTFVVFVLPPSSPQVADSDTRLGITMSRRVGNAVVRNRVKRRVREWFRSERGRLASGSEWVVIGRRAAADLSGAEVAAQLNEATRCSQKSTS